MTNTTSLIDGLPEIDLIQQALLDASNLIGEDNLPDSIKDGWAAAQHLAQRINNVMIRLKRRNAKKYEEGKLAGFKEGWNADPLKIDMGLQGKHKRRKQ